MVAGLAAGRRRAAYVGASNGDDPAFYSIFQGAMEAVGIGERRMVLAHLPAEDREFLERADLVLLAGGDPVRGWRAFEESGIGELVVSRYWAGATLVGVSAGAVQLGWGMPAAGVAPRDASDLTGGFRLVPYWVGVHQEDEDWATLAATVAASGTNVPGIGVPGGGAAIVHPDHTLEPVRRPLVEIAAARAEAPGEALGALPGEVAGAAAGQTGGRRPASERNLLFPSAGGPEPGRPERAAID